MKIVSVQQQVPYNRLLSTYGFHSQKPSHSLSFKGDDYCSLGLLGSNLVLNRFIEITSNEKASSALFEIAERIKNDPDETIHFIDPETGGENLYRSGNSDEIPCFPEDAADIIAGKYRGNLLIHSHPGEGEPFSFEDLKVALIWVRASYSVVANKRGIFILKIPENWIDKSCKEAQIAFNSRRGQFSAADRIMEEYFEAHDEYKKTSDVEVFDRMWEKIIAQNIIPGLKYYHIPWSDSETD